MCGFTTISACLTQTWLGISLIRFQNSESEERLGSMASRSIGMTPLDFLWCCLNYKILQNHLQKNIDVTTNNPCNS